MSWSCVAGKKILFNIFCKLGLHPVVIKQFNSKDEAHASGKIQLSTQNQVFPSLAMLPGFLAVRTRNMDLSCYSSLI